MPYLILLVLLTVVVSMATTYLLGDPGYLYLRLGGWQVELSLILGALLLFLVVVMLFVIFNLLIGIVNFPKSIRRLFGGGGARGSKRLISRKGLIYWLEEDWNNIQQRFEHFAAVDSEPEVGYMVAAYTAQQQGNLEKRNQYLARAWGESNQNKHLVYLLAARLFIASEEYASAAAQLKKVCSRYPKHKTALRMLAETYQKNRQWSDLYLLLPHLQKAKAYSQKEYNSIAKDVYQLRMQSLESASELLKVWKKSPGGTQNNPEFTATYVRKLLEFNRHEEAEKVLRRVLNISWDSELARLYGLVHGQVDKKRLYTTAVKWLEKHDDDPELLLTVGKLARRNDDSKQARLHLESAIENGGRREAYEELGDLLIRMGETEAALQVYKRGIFVSKS